MKSKFQIKDRVKTGGRHGTVTEITKFADHFEYLVEYPDGTGCVYHEDRILPPDESQAKEALAT